MSSSSVPLSLIFSEDLSQSSLSETSPTTPTYTPFSILQPSYGVPPFRTTDIIYPNQTSQKKPNEWLLDQIRLLLQGERNQSRLEAQTQINRVCGLLRQDFTTEQRNSEIRERNYWRRQQRQVERYEQRLRKESWRQAKIQQQEWGLRVALEQDHLQQQQTELELRQQELADEQERWLSTVNTDLGEQHDRLRSDLEARHCDELAKLRQDLESNHERQLEVVHTKHLNWARTEIESLRSDWAEHTHRLEATWESFCARMFPTADQSHSDRQINTNTLVEIEKRVEQLKQDLLDSIRQSIDSLKSQHQQQSEDVRDYVQAPIQLLVDRSRPNCRGKVEEVRDGIEQRLLQIRDAFESGSRQQTQELRNDLETHIQQLRDAVGSQSPSHTESQKEIKALMKQCIDSFAHQHEDYMEQLQHTLEASNQPLTNQLDSQHRQQTKQLQDHIDTILAPFSSSYDDYLQQWNATTDQMMAEVHGRLDSVISDHSDLKTISDKLARIEDDLKNGQKETTSRLEALNPQVLRNENQLRPSQHDTSLPPEYHQGFLSMMHQIQRLHRAHHQHTNMPPETTSPTSAPDQPNADNAGGHPHTPPLQVNPPPSDATDVLIRPSENISDDDLYYICQLRDRYEDSLERLRRAREEDQNTNTILRERLHKVQEKYRALDEWVTSGLEEMFEGRMDEVLRWQEEHERQENREKEDGQEDHDSQKDGEEKND